ncbi:MAG: hypothetical protein BWY19_01137 [bacterium ADurb.Bin212]|nr:MAG: hypothetical protein BWY19_01137 [bacterium ADurb.Bin212]
MSKEPIIGSESDKMTESEKHFKVVGLMTLGFLIKRKKLVLAVVALGIISAIVLTYILIF